MILVVSAAYSQAPEQPAGGCVAENPTSLSATWTTLLTSTGSHSFSYPADWEDVSGDIGATANELLAPETLEELGLTSEPIPGHFVQDPVSGDNIGAFSFGQPASSIETIVQRQIDLFRSIPGVSVTDPDA
jgi:hypothetical protein